MIDKKFILFDVGASMGIHPRWKPLNERFQCFGFEPNYNEFSKISTDTRVTWINAALADRDGTIELNITKAFENSSTRRPNSMVLDDLAWGDDHLIVNKIRVPCKTLNTIIKENSIFPDFIKLDTQGTELDIIKSASTQVLDSLVGIELEVSFLQLYEGQSLFSEVDIFLSQNGFVCWDLGNILRLKPRGITNYQTPFGRLISCDALYFKVPRSNMPQNQLAKLLTAMSIYGYVDEACFLKKKFNLYPDLANYWTHNSRNMLSSAIPCHQANRLFLKIANFFLPRRSSNWLAGLGGRH